MQVTFRVNMFAMEGRTGHLEAFAVVENPWTSWKQSINQMFRQKKKKKPGVCGCRRPLINPYCCSRDDRLLRLTSGLAQGPKFLSKWCQICAKLGPLLLLSHWPLKTKEKTLCMNVSVCVCMNMYWSIWLCPKCLHMSLNNIKFITGAPFRKSHLSSHARRLLAAAMRSTTEVRKSLGSLRVALPS